MAGTDDLTWRSLNQEGCEQGRTLRKEVEANYTMIGELKTKLDRLTWAMVSASIGLGVAALMLALNLLT